MLRCLDVVDRHASDVPPSEEPTVAEKDYFSFDEVLKNLAMEEDELKRLVSAGEIRAFRDQDRMKFKAEDVDRLREPDELDDLDLDDDLELDLGDDLELDGDDLLEDDGDDLMLDDDDDFGDVEEIDLSDAESKSPRSRKSGGAPARSTPRSKATAEATEEATEGPLVVAGLIVGFLILLMGTMVVLDGVGGSASNGLTEFVANLFAN